MSLGERGRKTARSVLYTRKTREKNNGNKLNEQEKARRRRAPDHSSDKDQSGE
jgi:hypothetical protein